MPEILAVDLIYTGRTSVFIHYNYQSIYLNKFNKDTQIDVYPNPASNVIRIRFSDWPEFGTKIIVTDINGKKIYSEKAQSILEAVNILSQPAAIYLVKIITGNDVTNQKIIKN